MYIFHVIIYQLRHFKTCQCITVVYWPFQLFWMRGGSATSFLSYSFIIYIAPYGDLTCLQGLSIVIFLVGALLTGMGLYEYPGEATLLTFARLPPAEDVRVEEVLKQSSVLVYRKVGLLAGTQQQQCTRVSSPSCRCYASLPCSFPWQGDAAVTFSRALNCIRMTFLRMRQSVAISYH